MTEAEWDRCTDPTRMLEFARGKVSDRKLRLFEVACCRCAWHLLLDPRGRQAVEAAERYADGALTPVRLATARASAGAALFDAGMAEYIAEAEADFQLTPPYRATSVELYAACAARATVSARAGVRICRSNPRDPEESGTQGAREDSRYGHEWAALALTEACRLALRDARPYAASRWGAAVARAGAAEPASLFRDLAGPLPFRPVAVNPSWRTPDVLSLAHAAYEQRELPAGTLDPARLALLADALEDAGCDNAEALTHLRGEAVHVRGCWPIDVVLGKE